jgi:alanine-glyoxylate transaminase/serine-glyoxylate transaminase/serine-pyruvate transaminase
MDRAKHPALLIVDAVSSLASFDYRHDEWGVDVTVCGSQKGLMVPPGLGFCAVSKKARAASKTAKLPRHYFDWDQIIGQNEKGFFPYTPGTNLFYGLREALQMLEEEGLANVFARHARHGEATRAAVRAWGLEIVCEDPREYSNSMTAVFMPEGPNAHNLRTLILTQSNMSLGVGPVSSRRRLPDRPSRQLQRPHAHRDAWRRRDVVPDSRVPHRKRRGWRQSIHCVVPAAVLSAR